jgi:hypothetical protein
MNNELLDKLRRINPLNKDGIPKNRGNCQWCAIEGARVLLMDVEPREIPNYEENDTEPIEERIHPVFGNDNIIDKDPVAFIEKIKELKVGELMLVNLEGELDHAYLIYKDEEGPYLIDPDKQVFAELFDREDFIQIVNGWDNVNRINYLNGDLNCAFSSNVQVDICVLNKNEVERNPLPEYGSEPANSYNLR